MPDWTYQTIFKRLLFAMGPDTGRDLAFGSLGTLARIPLGRHLIRFMGHMVPDSRLAFNRNTLSLRSPIGIGCRLDSRLAASHALAEFGVGYLEVGPISLNPALQNSQIELNVSSESILIGSSSGTLTPLEVRTRLAGGGQLDIPLFARIHPDSPSECRKMVDELSSVATAFVFSVERIELAESCLDEVTSDFPFFVAFSRKSWADPRLRELALSLLENRRIIGFVVDPPIDDSGNLLLASSEFSPSLEFLVVLRELIGPDPILIASVGIHSPADALDSLSAGADLVQLDSGLVFAGPGLPKRINEALLYLHVQSHPSTAKPPVRLGAESWFWAFLMGLAMLIGGVLALIIASTRVLLPYDEAISGFSRESLLLINDRLLDFMTHDRVTLAGTMLADAILYIALASYGLRRGSHWAYLTVICSAFLGFISFFSFLGFGYFDPFHAFVTAVMFQFLTLTMHSHLPERRYIEMPDLHNDYRWRSSQWGQLVFIIHGAIIFVAGLIISWVGMTSVLIREDMEFMRISAEELCGPNSSLLPLIAHDRATFGGMLISCGVAVFLSALWGFGRSRSWLWWSLVLAGSVAYVSTIIVHWSVGYTSLKHLFPAYAGLVWLGIGALASRRYMIVPDPQLHAEWTSRLNALSSNRSE